MKRRWWGPVLPLALVLMMLGAACGDDDDDTTQGGTEATSQKASGTPFKIGLITTEGVPGVSLPELREGALAVAEYVNNELEGIGGRPVEIVACNDSGDPAKNLQCAQQFVDEKVLAVIGLNPFWSDAGLAVATKAGIPSMTTPVGQKEYADPMSFPLVGASAAQFPAQAKYFATEKGVKKASIIYPNLAVGELAAKLLLANPLNQFGVTDVNLVAENLGAPDMSPAVTKAMASKPDVIFMLFSAADCARVLTTAKQLGNTAPLVGSGSCNDKEQVFDVAGPAAEGAYFSGDFLSYLGDDPEVKTYRENLDQYSDASPSVFTQTMFADVLTLREIGNEIGADQLTPASLVEYLKTADGLHVYMSDTLSPKNAPPMFSQLHNVSARLFQWKGGTLVDVGGGWINGWVK